MPLPSFRIRTLMIAVAVVAFALWSAVAIRAILAHKRSYERKLEYANSMIKIVNAGLENAEDALKFKQESSGLPKEIDFWAVGVQRWNDHVSYYREMKAKYERATRYPWLPVPPDPPEPE